VTPLYLDHGTTTPLDPRARAAMEAWLGHDFGSASSPTRRGARAREAIAAARGQVAALLHVAADEILFVASASEANNLAVKGVAAAAGGRGRLVAAATEHVSILHPLRTLERAGCEVVLLPVDGHGLLDPEVVRRTLRRGDLLLSVAHASAEIGTLQPVEDLHRVAREAGVPFHCDATATLGFLPWPEGAPADLLTAASQTLYGPQGAAALRVPRGLGLRPLIEGGTQEGGRRAGTEPIALLAGFGAAAEAARLETPRRAAGAARRGAMLRAAIEVLLEGIVFTGHPERRIPGHLSLCVRGVEGEALLSGLEERDVEASSGSACTTALGKPSHVLLACGIDPVLARGAVGFQFGSDHGDADAERAARALADAVVRLRALSPLG
jgi:cysteine desulfurase